MITLLDTLGPAIWRASWQAAALAILIWLIVRCFGERLSPRWRFLLWSVVIARLLFVATPISPWSVFNLVRWNPEQHARPVVQPETAPTVTSIPIDSDAPMEPFEMMTEPPQAVSDSEPDLEISHVPSPVERPVEAPAIPTQPAEEMASSIDHPFNAIFVGRILSAIWLAVCLLLGLKLLATALVLHRRLSACRPVSDASLLKLLETCCRRIGVKRIPALLVTPESFSPCTAGIWRPRIILPESIVTESSPSRLSHVLAHELAHIVRGDLWTNWLMLIAKILHWFNPVAWWTVREMQAEREAACDDLAFASLDENDRSAYAATIIELAASLAPTTIAPGLVGFLPSTCRFKMRVERFMRSGSVKTFRAPVAVGLLLGVALLGLTDAMPGVEAQAKEEIPSEKKVERKANSHTISGRCLDAADRSPLAGVSVRLYKVEGRTSPPVEVARTVTGADGLYTFTDLAPPQPEKELDRLAYGVVGVADNRPIGITFFHFHGGKEVVELRMASEGSMLAGRVLDAEARPVAGAKVMRLSIHVHPLPDLGSATTDADGRFKLENVGVYKWPGGKTVPIHLTVLHPDHPKTTLNVTALPTDVLIRLPEGCTVMGTVTDAVMGQPAAGAEITVRRTDERAESFVATDKAGQFRVVVPEGRYDFLAAAKDRVSVALTDRECLAGKTVQLPAFKLIAGGFISGQVINTATGQPVSVTEEGKPIMLGLFGPSQPAGKVISPARLAEVDDETGHFLLRAVPGENYPYFVNIRGERMAWDTRKKPPVVVKEGETNYDMFITPPASPEEKLKAARTLVEGLPKKPSERTARILDEFRKLNHTVDETELWCLLMQELVSIGSDAVPQLCAELDRTTENRMLRRLGFALRAIGDPRAVPALIRAIPKSLLPSSSDYGLIVGDKELTAFMQTHDLRKGKGGTHFGLGRPVREVFGTLHKLAGQNFADAELFNISLSEDPRRQVLQRRLYQKQAQRWQVWWEANWQNFTKDAAYQIVNLKVTDEPLPPASKELGEMARISGVMIGAVLSPSAQEGQHAWHLYDLDTGYRPKWPSGISRDEASRDEKKLDDWASERGIDLMCITHRSPDGTETYVLRALGMKVKEISPRDLRNLDRLVAAGKLPEGRPVDELLMHYDPELRKFVPDANAAFLFVTREGNMGLIETTDRITRTADLTGRLTGPPAGVGFHKGVRFNLKTIIP